MKINNAGGLAGLFPLLCEISLLERQASFGRKHHGSPSLCCVERGFQSFGTRNTNCRGGPTEAACLPLSQGYRRAIVLAPCHAKDVPLPLSGVKGKDHSELHFS